MRDEAPLYYNEKLRLLRAEPLRRRRDGPRSTGRPTARARARVLELIKANMRDAARDRSSSRTRRSTTCTAACCRGVFTPKKMHDARAEGPRVLRRTPRPARRLRRVRLHRRPRRADADAHDRHAARHPRGGPGGDPRPHRRGPAPRRGRAMPTHERRTSRWPSTCSATTSTGGRKHPSDDLMTELLTRRVRGRRTERRTLDDATRCSTTSAARRRRQRDDDAAHRLDRQGARRAPRPARRARRGPLARPQRDRGDPALRGAVAGAGALT